MSVTVSEQEYGNFGKCVFLDNGKVRLGVTVDHGPRIIYFSLCGKKNIMFEDAERTFTEPAGEYGTWVNYGGHRLWCSPEVNPETYYPDNAPVAYSVQGNKATFTPPVTAFGKQFSITVVMDEDKPAVDVSHSIKNVSGRSSKFAAWAITGLTIGGVCKIPFSTKKTGYLANRVLSLWDYTDVNDPRLSPGNSEIRIRQDIYKKNPIKIGINADDVFGAYAVNGQIFVKTTAPYDADAVYPDFSCNFEVYTNSRFLEMENIGIMKEFADGETAEISEKWILLDNADDNEPGLDNIEKAVKAL